MTQISDIDIVQIDGATAESIDYDTEDDGRIAVQTGGELHAWAADLDEAKATIAAMLGHPVRLRRAEASGGETRWTAEWAEVPTTIAELAGTIAERHGIDSLDAARGVVQFHADQIADDPNLSEDGGLTPAGVDLVTAAIAESYANGYFAPSAQQFIEDIAAEAAAIAEAEQIAAEHTARRDELIRAALRTELPRAEIAAAAGVKEARLYQIRDGRR
jgi:hypothetical protein